MQKYRVALVGLDGSGKSANINRMKADAGLEGFSFVWVRWEPKLLAPAYWLLNLKLKKKDDHPDNTVSGVERELSVNYESKSEIKRRLFQNRFLQFAWLAYAKLDYVIQFYCKVTKLLLKGNNIIFDRYFVDLFVDQGLNFGCTPQEISAMIRKNMNLFPQIHKTIYIRTSPEICFKRKDDIPSMDYLLKRYAVYEQLSVDFGWFAVDGEAPFEEVYSQIKELILTGYTSVEGV